jgi:hypothetical protein
MDAASIICLDQGTKIKSLCSDFADKGATLVGVAEQGAISHSGGGV